MTKDLTPNQERLLKQVMERKNETCPAICLHVLGQDLVNELCAIIINLQEQLDHHEDMGKEMDTLL